ncbi:MAG: hypothetical protein ACRERD_00965 [Candidatus Binatia bacterium]
MPKFRTALIIILLAFAVLAIANPSPDRHTRAFREALQEKVPLTGLLNLDVLVSKFQTYHSAVVFSWTEIDSKVVTYGFLGSVWVDEQALQQRNRR